ncbi:MAG: hypothetical protein JXP73_07890 [Deltaproteobacteria bacterium]|jgi:hypothetical protein|nr:hypothetical protein [Deltaproteobacteria bacterium]
MDSDEALRAAVSCQAAFALVRVASVAREKAGTRSQVAAYDCEVLATIGNSWPNRLRLKHFGLPAMEVGGQYVVGAVDNRRHHGAPEIRFALRAEGAAHDVVAAFVDRRATVVAPR